MPLAVTGDEGYYDEIMSGLLGGASAEIAITQNPAVLDALADPSASQLPCANPGLKLYASRSEIGDVVCALKWVLAVQVGLEGRFLRYLEATIGVARNWVMNAFRIPEIVHMAWCILRQGLRFFPTAEIQICVLECAFATRGPCEDLEMVMELAHQALEGLVRAELATPEIAGQFCEWVNGLSITLLDIRAKRTGLLTTLDLFDDEEKVTMDMDRPLDRLAEMYGQLIARFGEFAVVHFMENVMPALERLQEDLTMLGPVNHFLAVFCIATNCRMKAFELIGVLFSHADLNRAIFTAGTLCRLGTLFEAFPLGDDDLDNARDIYERLRAFAAEDIPDSESLMHFEDVSDAASVALTRFVRANLQFLGDDVLASWMEAIAIEGHGTPDAYIVWDFLADIFEQDRYESLGESWAGQSLRSIVNGVTTKNISDEAVARIGKFWREYIDEYQADPLVLNICAELRTREARIVHTIITRGQIPLEGEEGDGEEEEEEEEGKPIL
jgi:hypothetical protein